MRILLLSPYPEGLIGSFLKKEQVLCLKDKATEADFIWNDITVSYGYRHIIPAHIVREHGIINIHTSFLPWNRGAHPCFWSFYDGTPRGVTIHYIDEGIDTGDILVQAIDDYPVSSEDTLRTRYDHLQKMAEAMFQAQWPYLRTLPPGTKQSELYAGSGSFHRKKDLEPIWPHLEWGWDTPVAEVEALGRRDREAKRDMGDRGQAVAGAES